MKGQTMSASPDHATAPAVSFQSISLHVADVGKSVAFYSRLPGAELTIHRPGDFAKFKVGAAYIQVVAERIAGKGFQIEIDAPDINALHDELQRVGLEPEGPPKKQAFGRTQFRVRDPDGNIVEFDQLDEHRLR